MAREVLSDEVISDKIKAMYAESLSSVLSANDIAYRAELSATQVKKVLPTLVATNVLTSLREEEQDLLSPVYDTRAKATYYMLPDRLEDLKVQRIKRAQRPFLESAKLNILKKYNVEVQAEFVRLWDEHMKKQEKEQ